jgi:hypothetical protein
MSNEKKVDRDTLENDAKRQAVEFVLNLANQKFAEKAVMTYTPAKDFEKAMNENATPGIYNRAYMESLKEIIALLQTLL